MERCRTHILAHADRAVSTERAAATPIADAGAHRDLSEAQAALAALTTTQAAERVMLVAAQPPALADQQRRRADAQRTLDQLQPQHERDQAEAQHAVDAAHQVLLDAQALAALPKVAAALPEAVAAQAQRAAEDVHAAESKLREALDAQDRMRTHHGIERSEAEVAVAQTQADLAALPEQQRAALVRLDADHRAAQILAAVRVRSARGQVDESAQAQERDSATALAGVHQAAVSATARVIPTPQPNTIVSHAAGRVVNVSADEKDGRLIVTLEVMP
ncbi:MAG: hypothetical protein M3R61_15755 [Chloroflexota bacterium]|nr:hypothetical protein [Chloroflexota bacterium]